MEDLLRGRIRRIRTMGRGERTQITDEGLSRGLGRSQGTNMEDQRNREAGQVGDAEREHLAGQFENDRQARADQLRAQLDRERMTQEMELARQRADLEREMMQARLAAESQQNDLDRASRESLAETTGGGGQGIRMSDLTMRQPGNNGGTFGNIGPNPVNFAGAAGRSPNALGPRPDLQVPLQHAYDPWAGRPHP